MSEPSTIQTLTELVQYLDGKFLRVDKRFEAVDARMDKMEFELQDFKSDTKTEFNHLDTGIDSLVHKIDTQYQEITSLIRKIARHETWIHKLAVKARLNLEY